MDQILASATAAGMTISSQDLAQIQQAMSMNRHPSDESANANADNNNTIGGDEEAPGLRFSSIKEGVTEEMSAAAHSFASTRLLPEIWRWAALCKLRNDITQLYKTKKQDENENDDKKSEDGDSKKFTYLQVTDQEIVGNCIPYTVVLKKTPDAVKILNIVCVIPCVEFNTHAVVTVDTEVIYNVTGKLLKTAEKIVLRATKKQPNIKNENITSKNTNDNDDDEAKSSFVVIPPSSIIDENNYNNNSANTSMMIVPSNSANDKNIKVKNTSSSSSSCDYTMKARMVWRTLHFVRKDGVSKGSFEIQSTACRAFSCECTETGNTFVWCGMKGSFHNNNNKSFSLLLSSGKFHEMWWRGFLECYTRPTIHLAFAWLLWQNNADLRKFVEKKQNNNKKAMTKTQKKRLEQLKQESKIVEYPSIPKRRQRNDKQNGKDDNSSSESEDDEDDSNNDNDNNDDDGENEETTNAFIEVEDFLEELKTKIHLTLFDHNPTFAVFGMGMNVITNYLSVLFPWTDCHVAELEPSVYASNVLSEDFAERSIDLLPSKKESLLQKQFELRQQDSRNLSSKIISTTTNKRSEKIVVDEGGRQIAHIGDVVQLLGVDLSSSSSDIPLATNHNNVEEEKEEEKVKNENILPPQIPDDGGLSIIFLDCFDPVAVNMDHSFKVLQACYRRLRRGGLLAVNTHLATTSSGQELRPFVEVFGGDEAVQVITIAGYQQILILCQKNRSNNANNSKKKSGTKKIIPPQNVREYRSICRVANACPVFVQVGEGVLRNIEKISFFGNFCDEVQEHQQEKQTVLKTPSKKKSNNNDDDDDDQDESSNEFILRPDSAPSTQFDNIIAPIITNISSQKNKTKTNAKNTVKKTTKTTGKNNRPSSSCSSSSHTSKNKTKPKIHTRTSATKQLLESSRPPTIAAYPNLFCAAKGRIHESCSCLLCAGKWLDPTIFTESRRIHVKKNINNSNKDAKNENEDSSVVVGRWMTRVLEFNGK